MEVRIDRAAAEVRSADAVAVVGAGLSWGPGLPMTAGLRPLLWHALDGDLAGRAILATRLGVADTDAKVLVGDDPERVTAGFAHIAGRPEARRIFQDAFAQLDNDRGYEPSPAHDALAELVHRGKVSYVVSLNWDTVLERSYERRYGRRLSPNVDPFAKPHGDARQPRQPWVLPHEPGGLPSDLGVQLRGLAGVRPRVLLIVGYSERDERIVQDLIAPLERRWRVVRIGPSASGELDIPLPADEALPRLLERLALPPEAPGWEYVTFQPQRGIGPAILGERLGPHDVDACPTLPEVREIRRLLPIAGSLTVIGPSGSGKSITVYQAARSEADRGWEVIRLSDPNAPVAAITDALRRLMHPTIAIVDDAQSVRPSLVRHVQELAVPGALHVLLVTTETVGLGTTVRLAAKRAVAELADSVRAMRDQVVPILRQLDPSIGDRALDVSFESRLAQAALEDTPWHFGFVLRGGWREARSAVASLRDADRADLCLAALSAGQLITVDAGVDSEMLGRLVAPLARSPAWLGECLEELRCRHRVGQGRTLRTPHARFAQVALEVVFGDRRDPERPHLFEMVRAALRGDGWEEPPSFLGISWLVEGLTYVDGLRGQHDRLVDAVLIDGLVERFRRAETGRDRGAVATALNLLRRWHPRATEVIRDDPGWISGWLAEVDGPAAYGLARLLNDLVNDDRRFARQICESVPVAPIMERVLSAQPVELYPWSEFLGRFAVAAGKSKVAAIADLLDETRLDALVGRSLPISSAAAPEFLHSISAYDRPMALRIIDRHSSSFAGMINRSPAEGARSTQDVLWWVLGFAPRFLTRRGPDREGRRVARRIARTIEPRRVASAIETAAPRAWQELSETVFFVRGALPPAYQAILDAIDIDRLDAATANLWSATPFALEELLNMVGWGQDHEPARALIARHEHEIAEVTPRLAVFAPEAIARRIRSGLQLSLGIGEGLHWALAALAVDALERADPGLWGLVFSWNADVIAAGLSTPQLRESRDAAAFLDATRKLNSEPVFHVVSSLDVDRTVQAWGKLYRTSADRRGIASLVGLVREEPTKGREIAGRLIARFPSLRGGDS